MDFLGLNDLTSFIKSLVTILSLITLAYAGFRLMTSDDTMGREDAKQIITFTIIGLCIVWLVPLIVVLIAGGTYCALT
ncbi:Uncharacterised protein [uncultured archaeon]|nr:Uncharacterised protein [uncultured archaeon]